MADEGKDPMRDAYWWFMRPRLAQPYEDILDKPIPEHLLAAWRRPQSGGALRGILARILDLRGKGK